MFKTYYPIWVKLKTEDRRYNKGYRIDTTSVLAHYKDRYKEENAIACIAATSGNIIDFA
jgi:fructoselysine-6-P-deglycase FrlB-like protein